MLITLKKLPLTSCLNTIKLQYVFVKMSASSVGYGNSVGDNLFQIASQVDTIIECRVEGAILLLKLIDIWEFPEARIQYFRIFFFFLPSLFFF